MVEVLKDLNLKVKLTEMKLKDGLTRLVANMQFDHQGKTWFSTVFGQGEKRSAAVDDLISRKVHPAIQSALKKALVEQVEAKTTKKVSVPKAPASPETPAAVDPVPKTPEAPVASTPQESPQPSEVTPHPTSTTPPSSESDKNSTPPSRARSRRKNSQTLDGTEQV